MRKPPSRWSIFWKDSTCYPISCAAAMVLFLAVSIKVTGTVPGGRGRPDRPVSPEAASMMLACGVALFVVLWAIVARRLARVRSLFDAGREVEAVVRKVKWLRRGTTLKLEFELDGVPYEVRHTFQRWRRTPAFKEGTRISVLVDPMNPEYAVPLALYAGAGAAPPISAEHEGGPQESKTVDVQHRLSAPQTVPGDDR